MLPASVSTSPPPSQIGTSEVVRRSANYHPSIWGDRFITYTSSNLKSSHESVRRIRILKNEVQNMLRRSGQLEKMNLVDALQRLGVAYHFEKEIVEALLSIYNSQFNYINDFDDDHDIYNIIALHFRLLRQHGYNISSEVFKNFKDENGEFKVTLCNDARAMLCLYEASHLRVQGDDLLDEAFIFSSKHLKSILPLLNSPLAEQVKYSLELPLHKCMPRLEARRYILTYEAEAAGNDLLLELAKLDFNCLQTMHQKELSDISRWWKDLDFASKLPFARDRLVECYFWILGVYFEPNHSMSRHYMTKIIAIASVIDDIYDVYATLEELKLFTDAIERWEVSASDDLPEYMKVCFFALLDVVNEIEERLTDEARSYRMYYAKEAVKILVRAYFEEAKWFNSGYVPTFEEYLDVSVKSSGYPMLAVQSLICLGENVEKKAFDLVISVPKVVRSSAIIARLVDDRQTYKAEQERGDAPSGIQCYMKQHGVSEEEACRKLKEMVDIAWKDINEEIIQKPNWLPLPFLLPALNFARMMEVFYKDGDGYTNSKGRTKERIELLLVEPVV